MSSPEQSQDLDPKVAGAIERAVEKLRDELLDHLQETREKVEAVAGTMEAPAALIAEEVLAPPAPPHPGTAALHEVMARMDRARTQAGILEALLSGAGKFASRAVVFLTRPEVAQGWGSVGLEESAEGISDLEVDYADDSAWSELAEGRGTLALDAHDCSRLCSRIDIPIPKEGVLIPLVLRDQVAAALYADRLTGQDPLDVSALQMLAFVAALTIETVPLRERSATPTLRSAEEAPEEEPALGLWGSVPAEPPPAMPEEPIPAMPEEPLSAMVEPLVEEPIGEEAVAEEALEEAAAEEPMVEEWAEEPAPEEPLIEEPPILETPAEELAALDAPVLEVPPLEPLTTEIPMVEEPPVAIPPEPPIEAEPLEEEPGEALDEIPWDGPAEAPMEPPPVEPEPVVEEPILEEPAIEGAEETLAPEPEELQPAQEMGFEVEAPEAPAEPESPEAPAPEAVEEPPAEAVEAEEPATEVAAPTDLDGPGWAFSESPTPADDGPSAAREEARRLARLLVTEIKLYNEEQVEQGKQHGDLLKRLEEDIERSRQIFDERVSEEIRAETDHFQEELVRILAGGDPGVLGPH